MKRRISEALAPQFLSHSCCFHHASAVASRRLNWGIKWSFLHEISQGKYFKHAWCNLPDLSRMFRYFASRQGKAWCDVDMIFWRSSEHTRIHINTHPATHRWCVSHHGSRVIFNNLSGSDSAASAVLSTKSAEPADLRLWSMTSERHNLITTLPNMSLNSDESWDSETDHNWSCCCLSCTVMHREAFWRFGAAEKRKTHTYGHTCNHFYTHGRGWISGWFPGLFGKTPPRY